MADADVLALIRAVVAGDVAAVAARLKAAPQLARVELSKGATRQEANPFFIPEILRYLMAGDTALHVAAAAHRGDMIRLLLAAGADVRARNRRGSEPLHDAAVGGRGASHSAREAQVDAIRCLVAAGADVNARNKDGTTALHRAVRARCAAAVKALLDAGADPAMTTKSGSTLLTLATLTTGASGSGTPEANAEQTEILRLLGA